MRRFDEAMAKRIQETVREAESLSAIEIAVRVVPRAAPYRDITMLWALIGGVLALEFALFSPMFFWPVWVVPATLGGAALGWLFTWRFPIAVRWLAPRKRRLSEAIRGARESFYDEAVSATRDHTGVLVYCAVWEDTVVVLPDHLLIPRAEREAWARVHAHAGRRDLDLTDRLLGAIEALARMAEELAPRTPDDPDELPDAPKIG